ncbi:hypothetical protein ACFV3T_12320, partial [Streptomyces albidoflavus]
MAEQLAPMPEDWQRALAVVAHPDDLEYGCAGGRGPPAERGGAGGVFILYLCPPLYYIYGVWC